MEGPPLGPGGEDITWPDQVAPRGRKASSTRKIKPQTSNLLVWPILRLKCAMPLGLSITTKANLLAGKYTFSYSESQLIFRCYM